MSRPEAPEAPEPASLEEGHAREGGALRVRAAPPTPEWIQAELMLVWPEPLQVEQDELHSFLSSTPRTLLSLCHQVTHARTHTLTDSQTHTLTHTHVRAHTDTQAHTHTLTQTSADF